MIDSELFLSASEPWIVRCGDKFEEIYEQILCLQVDNPSLMVIVLDGGSMTTSDACYDELLKKLGLPDYFGRNFDALDECIADLSWLDFGAIVLLIKDSEKVLMNESPEKLKTLLDILQDAGVEWSHSSFPFHTILF